MDTKDVPAGLKNAMHAQSIVICSESHGLKEKEVGKHLFGSVRKASSLILMCSFY